MQEKLATEPQQITMGETTFIYDVATLINAVYQTTIELTKDGNVPKRIAKKIRPLLKGQERREWDGNDIYIDMVVNNLLRDKIITQVQPPLDNAKFRLAPGPGFAQWAKKNMLAQTSQQLDEWQANYNWLDVPKVAHEQNNYFNDYFYSSYNSLNSQTRLRSMLLQQLSTYPAGSWYSVANLVQEIWDANPDLAQLQRLRGQPFSIRSVNEKPPKNNKRDLFAEWAYQTAPSLINMLYSSLIELGIVDVGSDSLVDGNKLLLSSCAFRITELGAQVMNPTRGKKASTEVPEPQKSLIIQPNYEILLLQPDLPTLYKILPFTQVKQVQMVSTLLLTQNSILRALQHGLNVEKILATLQELSQKELPQNVVYSLQDWVRQHKQATISQVILLELSDEETATRLCQHPTLVKMNVRQLTPILLAIPFNESGSVNYQSIQQLLDKENIFSNFLGLSRSSRNRDRNYY